MTIDQIKAAWPCLIGRTFVIQGYLRPPNFESGTHYLYDSLDAIKYEDFGKKIAVHLSAKQLSDLSIDFDDGKNYRVKITAKPRTPEVLENVTRILLLNELSHK